jgi:hypothetical protein
MGRRPIGEDTMTAAERRRRRRRKPGGRKLDITEAHIAAVEARIKELKCPSDTIEKSSPPPRDPVRLSPWKSQSCRRLPHS